MAKHIRECVLLFDSTCVVWRTNHKLREMCNLGNTPTVEGAERHSIAWPSWCIGQTHPEEREIQCPTLKLECPDVLLLKLRALSGQSTEAERGWENAWMMTMSRRERNNDSS